MKLREIREPVIGPYPRKRQIELKRLPPTLTTKKEPTPKRPVEPQKAEPVVQAKAISEDKLPFPFQPISPLDIQDMPPAMRPIMAVMLRQLRDMEGPMPNTSAGAVSTLRKLESDWREGKDISHLQHEIAIQITGQAERRDLTMSLFERHEDERFAELLTSRSKWEDFFHACQRRSDLSICEGMALSSYTNNEIEKILAHRSKRSSAGEVVTTREPFDLVSKANLPTQIQHKELQSKFNDVSPQECEILRKLGFKLKEGLLAARITKTTETVEVIRGPE